MSDKMLEKYYFQDDDDLESVEKKHLWFRDALEKNEKIQFLHGWNLLEDRNTLEGKSYLKKAADNGSSRAAFLLADCYAFGEYGFEKNEDDSIPFYMKACEYGERQACQNIYKLLKRKHGKMRAMEIIGEEIGRGRFLLGLYLPIRSIMSRLSR